MLLQSPHVALAMDGQAEYPEPPFHPPEQLPEFKDSWLSAGPFDPANRVYRLVREALFRLVGGYDIRTGRVDLDALRVLGQPQNIVVKPNWVRQEDDASRGCIITHASVLRAIIDYLLLAFGEHCKITVGDVPLQSTNIAELWRESGIDLLSGYYEANGLAVNFRDWRREKILMDYLGSSLIESPWQATREALSLCRSAATVSSRRSPTGESRFSVNDYEPGMAACYHRRGQHGYLVSRTALEADLFINVAKLKTHCKAGMTGCMKNLIGINGEKAWIPHFRRGAPRDGGDDPQSTSSRDDAQGPGSRDAAAYQSKAFRFDASDLAGLQTKRRDDFSQSNDIGRGMAGKRHAVAECARPGPYHHFRRQGRQALRAPPAPATVFHRWNCSGGRRGPVTCVTAPDGTVDRFVRTGRCGLYGMSHHGIRLDANSSTQKRTAHVLIP